jgi:hypothetical protein
MVYRNRSRPIFARLPGPLSDRWWFALPVFALLLLTPTLLNGQPFLNWDTAQYYHYGVQLVGFVTAKIGPTKGPNVLGRSEIAKQQGSGTLDDELDDSTRTTPNAFDKALIDQKSQAGGMATYGGRSPFYSMWLYSASWAFGLWGVLITQAAATAWIIWRAATHAAAARRFEAGVAIVTLATLGGSAGFVIGFVMPDIYAAVAVICVALFFAYADRMSFVERLGLAAILAVSAAFHATHLVVAAALTLAGIGATRFLRSEKRPLRSRALLATVSALVVAVALQFAFDTAGRAVLGTSPKRPPLLIARLVADGPGRLYLDSVCPETATFLVCSYRNRSFKSSDEFLWNSAGVFQTMSVEQRLRLIEEEPRFVTAVAMRYPLSTLKAVVANAVKQFVLVWPAEAWMDPGVSFSDPALSRADLFQVAPFLSLCVANLGKCVPALPEALIASSVAITVILSFSLIAAHFVAARRRTTDTQAGDRRYGRAMIFAFLILVGLVVNAGICGAISGPHARYQTRVVWLAVLAAGVLEATHPIIVPWFRKFFARIKEL